MNFIIIGGGPVGLCSALLLAKQGYACTVYESRGEIPNNPEESYPIGVNPRGLHAVALIDPSVARLIKDTGKIVDSWQIFGGKSKVATLESGVVYGTSRAKVNLILWEAAAKNALITIKFNHILRDMDFQSKELFFQHLDQNVTVSAKNAKVIAADGVNSSVRHAMEKQSSTFKATVIPWTFEFRVLFGKPGETNANLDQKVHYIFNGCYAATIDNGGQQQWTLVMGTRDTDSPQTKSIKLGKHASPKAVGDLRNLIDRLAPLASPIISDEELRKYFDRRTFRGSIVKCNRVNYEDWIVLLGDAAHSVLPPVGEGINRFIHSLSHECIGGRHDFGRMRSK